MIEKIKSENYQLSLLIAILILLCTSVTYLTYKWNYFDSENASKTGPLDYYSNIGKTGIIVTPYFRAQDGSGIESGADSKRKMFYNNSYVAELKNIPPDIDKLYLYIPPVVSAYKLRLNKADYVYGTPSSNVYIHEKFFDKNIIEVPLIEDGKLKIVMEIFHHGRGTPGPVGDIIIGTQQELSRHFSSTEPEKYVVTGIILVLISFILAYIVITRNWRNARISFTLAYLMLALFISLASRELIVEFVGFDTFNAIEMVKEMAFFVCAGLIFIILDPWEEKRKRLLKIGVGVLFSINLLFLLSDSNRIYQTENILHATATLQYLLMIIFAIYVSSSNILVSFRRKKIDVLTFNSIIILFINVTDWIIRLDGALNTDFQGESLALTGLSLVMAGLGERQSSSNFLSLKENKLRDFSERDLLAISRFTGTYIGIIDKNNILREYSEGFRAFERQRLSRMGDQWQYAEDIELNDRHDPLINNKGKRRNKRKVFVSGENKIVVIDASENKGNHQRISLLESLLMQIEQGILFFDNNKKLIFQNSASSRLLKSTDIETGMERKRFYDFRREVILETGQIDEGSLIEDRETYIIGEGRKIIVSMTKVLNGVLVTIDNIEKGPVPSTGKTKENLSKIVNAFTDKASEIFGNIVLAESKKIFICNDYEGDSWKQDVESILQTHKDSIFVLEVDYDLDMAEIKLHKISDKKTETIKTWAIGGKCEIEEPGEMVFIGVPGDIKKLETGQIAEILSKNHEVEIVELETIVDAAEWNKSDLLVIVDENDRYFDIPGLAREIAENNKRIKFVTFSGGFYTDMKEEFYGIFEYIGSTRVLLEQGTKITDQRNKAIKMKSILVVEDDSTQRRAIIDQLGKLGNFELLEAENEGRAVSIASSRPIDIVFVDRYLGADDGIEVAKKFSDLLGASCKIVGMSGENNARLNEEFMAAGASLVLEKPVRMRVLESIVSSEDIAPVNKVIIDAIMKAGNNNASTAHLLTLNLLKKINSIDIERAEDHLGELQKIMSITAINYDNGLSIKANMENAKASLDNLEKTLKNMSIEGY